jgi:phosphoribosylanthranilate isomerase
MSVHVKICGITRCEDALLAERLGAFAIGFVFYSGSPRYIEPEAAGAISRRLGPFIARIGVFVDEDPGTVRATVRAAGLTAVQLHGSESPAYVRDLDGITVIKAFRVGDGFDPRVLTDYPVNLVLLDTAVKGVYGGTGKTFDWERALPCRKIGNIIIAGGLTAENVVEAVRITDPWGVDVSGGVESSPGVKDEVKMRYFFQRIQETFR